MDEKTMRQKFEKWLVDQYGFYDAIRAGKIEGVKIDG